MLLSRVGMCIHTKFPCSCLQKCTILKSTHNELQNARVPPTRALEVIELYHTIAHTRSKTGQQYVIFLVHKSHTYNNTSHTHIIT